MTESAANNDDSMEETPTETAEADAMNGVAEPDAVEGVEATEDQSTDADQSVAAEDTPDVGDAGLATLRKDYNELNDRHLRLAAEFNNYRRRSEAERLEAWSRAQADLMEGMLEVLDDLNRVANLDLSNATVEAIMEGIDLVERKFVRAIADAGVEEIDPQGDVFDPERMEAMMRIPTESEAEDDLVAQVFQKGYSLKGILVRPARVSVHKHG